MQGDSRYRVFEFAPKRIRHVTNPRSTVGQPLQLCRRDARGGDHRDPAETRTFVFAERLDLEIGETFAMFLCNMGDRKCETGRNRAQQHLGRPRPSIVSAHFNRLIDTQLELTNPHSTLVPAVPTGGNASHG